MKKSMRKLLVSSLALILTLAVTVTSTYAWFNMNTEVNTSFDVSVTTDSGFQVAIVPFTYNYTTDGSIEAPAAGIESTLTYKNFVGTADFVDLFTKNVLNPASLDRTTDAPDVATPISFVNVSNQAYEIVSKSTDDGVIGDIYNAPYLKFRVYFRTSAIQRTITFANTTTPVSITAASGSTPQKEFSIGSNAAGLTLFEKYIAATTAGDTYTAWKSDATKVANDTFTIKFDKSISTVVNGAAPVATTADDSYISGKVTFDGTNYALSLAEGTSAAVKSNDYTDAFRVAFESGSTANSNFKRYIFDKTASTAKEDVATTNIGWIYYTSGLEDASGLTFKKPVTTQNVGDTLTNGILTIKKDVVAPANAPAYGFVDVTIWLEGFDNDCFDSIIGTAANFAFGFKSL